MPGRNQTILPLLDLTQAVAVQLKTRKVKLPRKLILEIFKELGSQMSAALLAGKSVKIPELGTLVPVNKAARIGRNPKKPQAVVRIPPRRSITVAPAKSLLRKLNGRSVDTGPGTPKP